MSKGHRSEVPELYCVFASKTLQWDDPSEGCFLLRATTALKKRKDIGENGIYFVNLQMDVSA